MPIESARSLERRGEHLTKPASSCSSFLAEVFLLLASLAPLGAVTGCAGLVSDAGTGNPPGPSALDITNVQAASATTSTSQIVWTTNVPADSAVDYGTAPAYGNSTQVVSAMVTSHQVTLSGLAAGTTYYYQVRSSDSKNNHGNSGGHTFKTSGFSISGSISPATGGSGATVTLSGAASTAATADSLGNYTFAGLANGTYVVAPSRAGFTFTPSSQSTTVNGTNVAGVNFTDNAAPVAPTITAQPANQTVTVGQTAIFTVAATGTAPLSYQWQKNSSPISGATSSTYTTPATTISDNGVQFSVVVSNAAGSVTSGSAMLTVSAAAVAPSITTQPANQTVTAGQTATFSVAATGTTPLTYQWKKNSVAISGANSSSYTTPAETTSDNGAQFTVVVSNSVGSAISSVATLTVNATLPLQITTSQLSNGTLSGTYAATLSATGGVPPYAWSLLSGTLPSGLVLNATGTISGTATLAGSYSFIVQVKDASGSSASGTFSINIATPVPTIAITAPANGVTVSGTITVVGMATDTVGVSSVQVSIDGGSFTSASGTSNWTFSLNTASLSNSTHTVTAKTTDLAAITATSSPVTITVNNGALAANCTLYASASGNDSNSGTSPAAPKTFLGAAAITQPGSVVCLLGGSYQMSNTFYPPNSGSPSSWIVYQAYGDGPVNFVWTAGAIAQPMFKFGNGNGTFPSGAAYLEFDGLNLDGQNNALDGFLCDGGHHLRFIGNTINNTGGAGIGTVQCDYLTSDHNLINHNGYLYGWTSGISYNTVPWFDSYPGFHNIISNNIITGEFDGSTHHTDGNGIILDLGGNTPPALIINNVVYGNGGRCIEANQSTNFWVVNNTCYKNDLDTSLGNVGSFTSQDSSNGYFINNIALSVASNNPSYDHEGTNANIYYYADMYYGSPNNFSYSDPSQLINANPLFLLPPSLSIGGYATSLAPSLLGSGLTLLPLSLAYNKGIDPSTLSGVPANIVSDLKLYIYTDISGKARPQGGGSDLGAYQH